MPARRKIDPQVGRAAVLAWARDAEAADRRETATAVRYTLEELALQTPGRTVEVRVPPFGAVQCVDGPIHTRGTPPNVIEMDALTWLEIATGRVSWGQAAATGRVKASGSRADLSAYLPIVPLR